MCRKRETARTARAALAVLAVGALGLAASPTAFANDRGAELLFGSPSEAAPTAIRVLVRLRRQVVQLRPAVNAEKGEK